MQQYFIKTKIEEKEIILDGDVAFHIQKVMRMKPETKIRLVDSESRCFLAAVQYRRDQVAAVILSEIEESSEMKCEVTLIMGLIRQEKWDLLLQKCSELGVKRIVPMISSRNVVKTKEEKIEKKLERWNKITQEACEQCKRFEIAEVLMPIKLNQCEQYKSEVNLIAYENAEAISEDIRSLLKKGCSGITVMIGPEGGFSEEEVEQAERMGFKRCSLGKRILRAETAAMYCCAVVNALIE